MPTFKLVDLRPHWVDSGGEGVYQKTDRPCPACPAGSPREECRICFGRGDEYEPAPARHGIGISFLCPCQSCTAKRTGDDDHDFSLRVFVAFSNPLDGKPPLGDEHHLWQRTGETFETLQLSPSILVKGERRGCTWHGFVGSSGAAPGEVISC